MGAVCKSWKLAVDLLDKFRTPPNIPWLMLAEENKRGLPTNNTTTTTSTATRRTFYDLSDKRIYQVDLPKTIGRKCRGVGNGWLFTIDLDLRISLLHALSGRQINLPHQTSFTRQCPPGYSWEPYETRDYYITKAIVSTNPWDSERQDYNQNCIVMTISGRIPMLAFAKLGDQIWTDIVQLPSQMYWDVAYYRNKFYTIGGDCQVYVCEFQQGRPPKATSIAVVPEWVNVFCRYYLVESSGGLLLVCRQFYASAYTDPLTKYFNILKLEKTKNDQDDKYELVEIESLGDEAIFVGDSASFSFSTSGVKGFKANHIYFTDDVSTMYLEENLGGSDMGAYNFEDDTIDRLYDGQSFSHFCTPLWFY
ncbi:hypothetical protein ACFE04_008935 [Oxalis oulophora]